MQGTNPMTPDLIDLKKINSSAYLIPRNVSANEEDRGRKGGYIKQLKLLEAT